MAQSNFEERIDTYEIESTNVMTGDRDRSRYLYYQLKMSMAKAKQIDIIVSFLMEFGVRLYNETSRSFHPKSYIFHYESSNEITDSVIHWTKRIMSCSMLHLKICF